MPVYPYDPQTGKKLTRSGFSVNPTSPMTQTEVDRQHETVNDYLMSESPGGDDRSIRFRLLAEVQCLDAPDVWFEEAEMSVVEGAISDPATLAMFETLRAKVRKKLRREAAKDAEAEPEPAVMPCRRCGNHTFTFAGCSFDVHEFVGFYGEVVKQPGRWSKFRFKCTRCGTSYDLEALRSGSSKSFGLPSPQEQAKAGEAEIQHRAELITAMCKQARACPEFPTELLLEALKGAGYIYDFKLVNANPVRELYVKIIRGAEFFKDHLTY